MPTTEPTTATDEIKTMGKIANLLEGVDRATADRIVGWLYDRYSVGGADAPSDETGA